MKDKPEKTKKTGSRKAEGRRSGTLSKDIQSRIGSQLRAMHDDIVRQGVPDRFVDLLARLDNPGKGK
jgi:hypothetical protein